MKIVEKYEQIKGRFSKRREEEESCEKKSIVRESDSAQIPENFYVEAMLTKNNFPMVPTRL